MLSRWIPLFLFVGFPGRPSWVNRGTFCGVRSFRSGEVSGRSKLRTLGCGYVMCGRPRKGPPLGLFARVNDATSMVQINPMASSIRLTTRGIFRWPLRSLGRRGSILARVDRPRRYNAAALRLIWDASEQVECRLRNRLL